MAAPPPEYKNLPRKRKRDPAPDDPGPPPAARKKAKLLLAARRQLPIWPRQPDILAALATNDVLVLAGETGSGKSTQVPQFLLGAPWCTGKIAVTQPRRVAAISLARRVAEEMGEGLGRASPGSRVGYSVRFDENAGRGTRVKFLTEGMLLQEMLRDAQLREYSCVVVDEVHERSVNVDLILGVLKGLVRERRRKGKGRLKVVVMSATADVDALAEFLDETGEGVDEVDDGGNQAEDAIKGVSDGERERGRVSKVSRCLIEGRQYPVKVHYLNSPAQDVIDATFEQVFKIHCKEPMPGDVLVFLTGKETIDGLQKSVEEFAQNLTHDFPKLLVLPLYASLPQEAQQRIFERAPPNTRKVILSTNIAETSVTVPGVRFVIDTGKAKMKQFRSRLGLESLLVQPISKSSADQRKGRAGREAAGHCYRLYTEKTYQDLEQDTKPEILRSDLSDAILKMKARGFQDVLNFPFLTPPNRSAMEASLLLLLQLNCLSEENGAITTAGQRIARLPLPPKLGKAVLEAARPDRDCLYEVIDIVACLSVEEDIFLPTATDDAREAAAQARAPLIRRHGDHLSLLATIHAYDAEPTDRRAWCRAHLVSHRAMRKALEVRKQLRAQCKALGLHATLRAKALDEAEQDAVLKCFVQGAGMNVARLRPDKTYRTLRGEQAVAIHPSSFLFGRRVEAILYNEFVYTNRAYARGVSAMQLRWLDEWVGAEEG